jgi:hypothetical protein
MKTSHAGLKALLKHARESPPSHETAEALPLGFSTRVAAQWARSAHTSPTPLEALVSGWGVSFTLLLLTTSFIMAIAYPRQHHSTEELLTEHFSQILFTP